MLKIVVEGSELFDRATQTFSSTDTWVLTLEHSLVSLSKWEQITEKPFLAKEPKTDAEVIQYVKCMTITPDVPSEVYSRLSNQNLEDINAYINAKMTATWFSDKPAGGMQEVITAELIYYWMIAYNIPIEFENWHLNRLFTLIKVCGLKNSPGKKMSAREVAERNRLINEQRREQYNTSG